MRRRRAFTRAFTLVELLVVIGIIALLIAILLPSLTRARMSANLVTCQSNFKQIYTAITFYANEHKGVLPWASRPEPEYWGPMGTNAGMFIRLSQLLGTKFEDEVVDKLNPVFTCIEARNDGAMWAPNLLRTVQFHPRAFPGYDQLLQYPNEYPQRKLSSIRGSAEKIMFWEAAQIPRWN